jgi:hemerythrin-like domain-containing protein
MPVQIGSKTSDFSDPMGLMSDCHRRIEMFLHVLQAATDLNDTQLTADERRTLDAALRYFREAAPKHNADEEESLFPRLRSFSDPEIQHALADVARLEQEHRWAAPLHAEIDILGQQWLREGSLRPEDRRAFSSAVARLDSMYRAHIDFEDRVLFPLAERVLSPEQRRDVAEEMARRRKLSGFTAPGIARLDTNRGDVQPPAQSARQAATGGTVASDMLRSEHRLVEGQLDRLLLAIKQQTNDLPSEVRRLLLGIQCLTRPHFDKEEKVLYPRLRPQFPELLSQLDQQHEYAREVEQHLIELLDAVTGSPDERQHAELVRFSTELCDVIQHHIVEEEDQLLRLVDSSLSSEEQDMLAQQMKKFQPVICTSM